MKARWNHIQGYLFPWLREEVDPITEALGRLVMTLDVIGLEAFVPDAERAALMYTLIQTAKLNDVDPQAWLTDVLARIADTPQTRLADLLPWNWTAEPLGRKAA